MAELKHYQGKRVGVLGLGSSGQAVARSLAAVGAEVFVFDDNPTKLWAFANSSGCHLGSLEDIAGLECLVTSPGVPLYFPKPHPAIERARSVQTPITGDIQLMVDSLDFDKLVGVTGTNGKSTTTALIHHLLRSAGKDALVGGNIGKPVAAIDGSAEDTVLVLELSSYQLDLCDHLAADVAVLLNITPDHLDRHGTFESYVAAKRRLIEQQAPSGVTVIGVEDETSLALANSLAQTRNVVRIASTGSELADVFVDEGRLVDTLDGSPQIVVELNGIDTLRGQHNHQNAAAAFAAVRMLGLAAEEAVIGLPTFAGLPHRMQEVARLGGIRFINDSKATNPDAAWRSLTSFDRIYWLAGGKPKPGGFATLFPYLSNVAKAYLFGEAAHEMADALGDKITVARCQTMETAITRAWSDLRQNGEDSATVLLAPACASFDQFPSFEIRGERFGELARAIIDRNGSSGAAA